MCTRDNLHRRADRALLIRCAECIHRGVIYQCPMLHLIVNEKGIHYDDKSKDDGFCDRGEGKHKNE